MAHVDFRQFHIFPNLLVRFVVCVQSTDFYREYMQLQAHQTQRSRLARPLVHLTCRFGAQHFEFGASDRVTGWIVTLLQSDVATITRKGLGALEGRGAAYLEDFF